jgi:hypothetical protein
VGRGVGEGAGVVSGCGVGVSAGGVDVSTGWTVGAGVPGPGGSVPGGGTVAWPIGPPPPPASSGFGEPSCVPPGPARPGVSPPPAPPGLRGPSSVPARAGPTDGTSAIPPLASFPAPTRPSSVARCGSARDGPQVPVATRTAAVSAAATPVAPMVSRRSRRWVGRGAAGRAGPGPAAAEPARAAGGGAAHGAGLGAASGLAQGAGRAGPVATVPATACRARSRAAGERELVGMDTIGGGRFAAWPRPITFGNGPSASRSTRGAATTANEARAIEGGTAAEPSAGPPAGRGSRRGAGSGAPSRAIAFADARVSSASRTRRPSRPPAKAAAGTARTRPPTANNHGSTGIAPRVRAGNLPESYQKRTGVRRPCVRAAWRSYTGTRHATHGVGARPGRD